MTNRDFEKDEYVVRWLTGLSEKTKEEYPKQFVDWLTFIGLTPTEQIQKRMHDSISTDIQERQFFEDKWRLYKQSLESTGTNSDSKVHDRIKVVSSFFTRNSLPLSLKKGDWKSTQKQQVKKPKLRLTQLDIKRMYGHAKLRDKCLLLILAQSGFSETDISELKIEDIKDLYTMPVNEHYVIEKKRNKSNHVQATALSYEFLHDLRDLLAERGNPTEGFIFTSQTKEKGIANIDVRRINESMKALAEKTFGTEKAKEFQTRSLRSFYNGALLSVKPHLNPEIKDLMMGHDRIGARNNYQYNDETIRESYISAFEYLTINGIQSREDISKIKGDLNKLIGQQQVQIEEQKTELKSLKDLVTTQSAKLDVVSEELKEVGAVLKVVMDMRKQEQQKKNKQQQ